MLLPLLCTVNVCRPASTEPVLTSQALSDALIATGAPAAPVAVPLAAPAVDDFPLQAEAASTVPTARTAKAELARFVRIIGGSLARGDPGQHARPEGVQQQ